MAFSNERLAMFGADSLAIAVFRTTSGLGCVRGKGHAFSRRFWLGLRARFDQPLRGGLGCDNSGVGRRTAFSYFRRVSRR